MKGNIFSAARRGRPADKKTTRYLQYMESYELLIRALLDLPSKPVILNLESVSWRHCVASPY